MDKKKLGALVDQHNEKKAPPKKPSGGKPPGGDHIAKEAEHEGDSEEHEQQEHDEGDAEVAEQQAGRVANGNGDDSLTALADRVDLESEEVPDFALDSDVWERAKKAVRGLETPPEQEQEASVIVHTYEALGGELDTEDGDGEGGGEEDDAAGDDDYGGE